MSEEILMTLEELDSFEAGSVFAMGVKINNEFAGLLDDFIAGDAPVSWVAKKGQGYNDWVVYYKTSPATTAEIVQHGKKALAKHHIMKFVPCTREMFSTYRY